MILFEISLNVLAKGGPLSVIRVVVNGATGRMGTETLDAICQEEGLEVVGAVSHRDRGDMLKLSDGSDIPLSTDLESILLMTKPSVVIDFTNASVCMAAVPTIAKHSVNMVLGASGLTEENLEFLDREAIKRSIGIVCLLYTSDAADE